MKNKLIFIALKSITGVKIKDTQVLLNLRKDIETNGSGVEKLTVLSWEEYT